MCLGAVEHERLVFLTQALTCREELLTLLLSLLPLVWKIPVQEQQATGKSFFTGHLHYQVPMGKEVHWQSYFCLMSYRSFSCRAVDAVGIFLLCIWYENTLGKNIFISSSNIKTVMLLRGLHK
jgi:hypothetical protein